MNILCMILLLAHGHHGHNHDHEEFEWTTTKSEYANVEEVVAGPGVIQSFTQASGTVLTHPDHIGYVVPKVRGSVVQIHKNIGDVVEKGEELAVIESPDVARAKGGYLAEKKRLAIYQKRLERERSLEGISAGQDLQDAEFACEEALITYENARQNLYAIGFSEDELTQLSEESAEKRRFYSIKAPVRGKVLQRDLTVGDTTGEENRAFTVANFDKVWVELNVSQDDVRSLKEGQSLEIHSSSGKCEQGKVCQFNPAINEETRMARAICVLKNSQEKWTPGQYVSASILKKEAECPVVVSKEAVQKMKGRDYVFVKEECGNFTPTKVKLGKMDPQHVEIVSGLNEGQTYISKNAFYLKADYEKEEVEHSH